MEAWQERVIEERDELDVKADRVGRFLAPGQTVGVSMEDRALLNIQYDAMKAYLGILHVRINRF